MKYVVINPLQLQNETLMSLISSFILREGTDYGPIEVDYEIKQKQVHQQILSGKVKILFDPESESINLMTQLQMMQIQIDEK